MRIIYFVFISLLIISCTPKSGYEVQGKVVNANSTELVLEKISQQSRSVVETVPITEDGSFTLSGELEGPGIFRLRDEKQQGVVLHLKDGDRINLELDFDNINNYTITGSEESARFQAFNTFLADRNESKKDLITSYRSEQDVAKRKEILKEVQGWDVATTDLVKERINNESSTLLGMLMIGAIPTEGNKTFYNQFNDRLQLDLPNSSYAKEFDNLVTKVNSVVSKPVVGDFPPEIEMANPDGEIMKLSDLKGKYVLIDFWAAWCGPCRKENPNLVDAYSKYNEQGLEIYSVSLDKTNKAWTRAIEQDNLAWDWHVSDLKFWNNSAAKEYGVRGIPTNFLLDPNGKVIATNLRSTALQTKLAEIFTN